MNMRIGIVIPTYNERENISVLVPKIFEVARKNSLEVWVLVVDDNSSDGTFEAVRSLSKKYPLWGILRRKKMGIGSAYIAGFREMIRKKFDVIMEMDGDMSHDPKYIPDFVRAIKKGNDVVIGSRKVKGGKTVGWNFYRKFVSYSGNTFGRFSTGLDVKDLTSGYRAYKLNVLKSIDLGNIKSSGYAFQMEMLYKIKKKNFRVKEIPIVFVDRKFGKSKLSQKENFEFAKTGLKIRFGRA
jgi:dolichol-phosphate mannosyltransferase